MTPNDQLDYALGQIDDAQRSRIEEEIADDPSLAETLDRLRTHLNLLLDDGEGPEPPADLARRTILHVEVATRRRMILDHMPRA